VSNELTTTLTAAEQKRFDQLRKVATDSMRDWCEALREIRDARLYRAEYDTFEDFCRIEIGKTRQRINQILNADLVRMELETVPGLERILSKTSTGAMEEIAKAPSELRQAVAEKVAAEAEQTGTAPTAAAVKRVAGEIVAQQDSPQPAQQPDDTPSAKFRKLRSVAKQHNAAMIRAIDSMNDLILNPGTHRKLVQHYEAIDKLLEGWPV